MKAKVFICLVALVTSIALLPVSGHAKTIFERFAPPLSIPVALPVPVPKGGGVHVGIGSPEPHYEPAPPRPYYYHR